MAAAILNCGMMGANLQQGYGVLAVGSDFCAKAQKPFTHTQGIGRDGLGICVHHYRLSLAALSITLLIRRLRRL